MRGFFTGAKTGSKKNDAYRWAIRRYIASGRCDARFAAYYIDSFWMKCVNPLQWDLHTLSNHDYFIARRAFFFDLATWGDETPVDDPNQKLGLDRPLPEIGGKGLFTGELENALLSGEVHAAVHSLKDLPVEDMPGIVVAITVGGWVTGTVVFPGVTVVTGMVVVPAAGSGSSPRIIRCTIVSAVVPLI